MRSFRCRRRATSRPTSHITNQRTMEIFRDLGLEADVLAQGTPHELMGDTVFCTSLAGGGRHWAAIRGPDGHRRQHEDRVPRRPRQVRRAPAQRAYWVLQPGADIGGIGLGLVRMVRPLNEWLIVWGYDISQPPPEVDEEMATRIVHQRARLQYLYPGLLEPGLEAGLRAARHGRGGAAGLLRRRAGAGGGRWCCGPTRASRNSARSSRRWPGMTRRATAITSAGPATS